MLISESIIIVLQIYVLKNLSIPYCLLISVFLISVDAEAQDLENNRPVPINNLFYNIDSALLNSFTANYGANHLLGVAGTYYLVEEGIDWKVYRTSHQHREILYAGFPAVFIGGVLPIALPYYLYSTGIEEGDEKKQWTALALGQAAILGATITSSYKAFTGRKPPEPFEKTKSNDFSHDFKWGILERGLFDGWPSGHTAVAFAMATTYTQLYPEKKNQKWLSFAYATWIGVSVSVNIHWFSDAFAGALIGYSIGTSVADNFKSKIVQSSSQQSFKWSLYPTAQGIVFSATF